MTLKTLHFWQTEQSEAFGHYFAKDFARNLVPGFSTFKRWDWEPCLKKAKKHKSPRAPLRMFVASYPNNVLQINIVEGLPSNNGYHAILTMIDRFTMYAEAVLLRCTKVDVIARAVLNQYISRHSIPTAIHSDRGGNRVLHAFWLKGGHFEVKEGHPDFLQISANIMIFLECGVIALFETFYMFRDHNHVKMKF